MQKQKTYAELKQKVIDLEAQLAFRYKVAPAELDKTGDCLMASAAVLTISALGGRVIVPPIAIINGLSQETIHELKKDISRSFAFIIK